MVVSKKWHIHILILIIIIGASLRFVGTDWGLPVRLHPDEGFVTNDAYRLAASRSFETKIYNRPNHISIKANALIYLTVNKLLFGISEGTTVEDNYSSHIKIFYMASRMFSALLGVLSIFLAYLICRRLHPDIGMIAATLYAIFPPFIEHAHYITPEIIQTFFMLLVIYFSVVYLEEKSMFALVIMSVMAAFATCEKYPAGYVCVIIAFCVIRVHYNNIKNLLFRSISTVCIYVASIFLISPVLLIDYSNVLAAVKAENHSAHLGADNLGVLGNFLYYFHRYFNHAGILLFCLAFIGVYFCIRHYRNVGIVFILGSLYIFPLSFTNLHWDRWGVPMYANMLLLSAVGAYYSLILLLKKTNAIEAKMKRRRAILSASLAAFFILPFVSLLSSSLTVTAGFVATDTRIASIEYCLENGISNENTYYEGYTALNPTGPGTVFSGFDNLDITKPVDENISYVIISSSMYNRYYAEPNRYKQQIEFYDRLKKECKTNMIFRPVSGKRSSPVEFANIYYSLSTFAQYVNGGKSGPTIIIYEI